MSVLLMQRPVRRRLVKRRVAAAIRVACGRQFVGSILLNDRGRTVRVTPALSEDVVLKILLAFKRRQETSGAVGCWDGNTYAWRVVGA
jgi:hypothetical protein